MISLSLFILLCLTFCYHKSCVLDFIFLCFILRWHVWNLKLKLKVMVFMLCVELRFQLWELCWNVKSLVYIYLKGWSCDGKEPNLILFCFGFLIQLLWIFNVFSSIYNESIYLVCWILVKLTLRPIGGSVNFSLFSSWTVRLTSCIRQHGLLSNLMQT